MDKKTIIVAGIVALAVSLLVTVFRSTPPVSTIDRVTREIVRGASGPNYTELQEFNGGVKFGNVNASTSVGTGTLNVNDVRNFDTVILTPTGAASTKTLTFFASSTAANWLPLQGERQSTCFVNASTSAAATITFAAGTGIDLEYASSTLLDSPPTLILGADAPICFQFIRGTRTSTTYDIHAAFIRYTDAD